MTALELWAVFSYTGRLNGWVVMLWFANFDFRSISILFLAENRNFNSILVTPTHDKSFATKFPCNVIGSLTAKDRYKAWGEIKIFITQQPHPVDPWPIPMHLTRHLPLTCCCCCCCQLPTPIRSHPLSLAYAVLGHQQQLLASAVDKCSTIALGVGGYSVIGSKVTITSKYSE